MNDLRAAVRDTWEKALDTDHAVEAGAVAERVIRDYPALIQAERERLIFAAILREIKQIARQETEESAQLNLFGFPAVIALPVPDDGFAYTRAEGANLAELEAGESVRRANVQRAQQKLDTYHAALARVRPVMDGHPEMTLAQAITQLGATDG